MPTSNQSETIDPRILRLIGLEDVFDLDYETYLTLLKEAMVKGRMVKKTIPTEEIMLLDEEYKRVKTKKDKGRFKVKTKKITAKSFSIGGKQLPGGKATKALPGMAIGKSSIAKSLDQNIAAITSSVVSIAEMMRQQAGLASEEAAYDRRRSEQQRRAVSENKLEKRFEGLKKAAEKIIAPVKGILDKIFGFLVKVFFGRVLYKLIEWFGDPKNAGKVKSVIRFLGDWWPALLGAYIIFGNSFGRFTTKIIFTVARFGVQLATKAIPGLISLARRNPATAALALGATTYLTNQALNSSDKQPTQQLAGGGYVRPRRFRGGGLASLRRFFGLDGGGYPGYVSGQKGVDKIPAMLSDGEFVMSRGAVQMYGADTLSAMNAAGGGTNRPKIMSGTTYAAGGGLIGKLYEGADRLSGGNLKPVVNEIIRGLSSQYKWANDLARKTGVNLSGVGNNAYNAVMSQGTKLQKDAGNLLTSAAGGASGIYNQVNNTVNDPNLQKNILNSAQKTLNSTKKNVVNTGAGIFGRIEKGTSSKGYENFSDTSNKVQDKLITFSDKFVKNLPEGPFREMMDKGLIPIPSGNAKMMRNLTFVKAMLGPLGKPFKIMSNKEVDKMRQQTIDLTAKKHGLITDPKTGQIKMNWNQEDINKGGRGGGAYTDKLGPGGKAFNSILGRFSASTEGKGNTLYTDDRYNFNKSVSEYAGMAKKGLLKGSLSDAAYYGASMAGRFAQDIGWLNQRALGSRIKIGTVKRPPAQIKKSKPVAKPVKPPAKPQPKVVYGPPVPSRLKNKKNSAPKTTVPNFTAGSPGQRSKTETLGLMR